MSLYDDLSDLNAQGRYPLHMPGHKRRLRPFPGAPVEFDFTEIEGSDDLHRPRTILAEAMRRTAELAGADRTFYLVNGSTGGNLAAVTAAVPFGGEMIVARNCHQSVFHALELAHIRAHWVWPVFMEKAQIFGSVRPYDLESLLERWPGVSAVIVTSPTYEGVLSDIKKLASICHRHGVPLLVDEAHGAHLGLVPGCGFPESAIHCGADIAVQSAHKTLIGLTQTAYLHLRSDLIDPEKVESRLDVFESSSPSYLLMLSLDGCTEMIRREGKELFSAWRSRIERFRSRTDDLKALHVLSREEAVRSGACFELDESKILVQCPDGRISGEALQNILRRRFHLELEMAEERNALAMTGPGDEEDALDRLADALHILDREFSVEENADRIRAHSSIILPDEETDPVMSIGEAMACPEEAVPMKSAEGRIAAESVVLYPPGIPALLPGERVTEKLVSFLSERQERLRFSRSGADPSLLFVLSVQDK